MSDARPSLTDRLAGLSFRTKLFAAAVVYMLVMFGVSGAGGGELASRVWFASALPISWLVALMLQWLSLKPRPTLRAAIDGVVEQARDRPWVAAFYAIVALGIETCAVAEALGHPVFR